MIHKTTRNLRRDYFYRRDFFGLLSVRNKECYTAFSICFCSEQYKETKELLITRKFNKRKTNSMLSKEEYSNKAAACMTKVRRTFLLTFCLVFITLTVLYGTTEHFSSNTTIIFQRIVNPRQYSSDVTNNKRSNSSQVPMAVTNSSRLPVLQNNTSLVTGSGNQSTPMSKEFPWMPDPCAKPRRQTYVEDLLCMEPPKFLSNYKNPCWMDKGVFRCLPYFHLFGICKSGTSDFFKRLLLHPDIIPNKGIFGKEIWYWSWKRLAVNYKAGKIKRAMTLKEFTDQFNARQIQNGVDANGEHIKITGHGDPMDIWDRFAEEATPQNTPGAEELLWTTPYSVKHINPDVKLLLMLRDPIDRLYSHYFHGNYGNSAQSFHDHITSSISVWKNCTQKHSLRHCIYSKQVRQQLKAPIYTSFYVVHLKEWLTVFPREQMFIFRNEDYSKNMKEMLSEIFKFLDVAAPDDNLLDKMVSLSHFYETMRKKKAGPMLESTKKLLIDLYRPYTEELAKVLKDDRYLFKDKSFKS